VDVAAYRRVVDTSQLRSRARALVDSPALTYRQRVQALAGLAEESLEPPTVSAEVRAALSCGLVDDLAEGPAPYRPRYLLPDYERALRHGSAYLDLAAPRDLYEAIAFLLSMYSQVPSITGYPVYLGDVDRLLEPYADNVDDATLHKLLRLMWVTIDRTLPDAFTHANLGPDDSRVGRTILALERELLQTVPNLTLRVDTVRTPDSLVLDGVRTVFACGKPHFVNHAMMCADLGPDYGVVSCYNSLKVGGGSHTLVRLNLARSAALHVGDIESYLAESLPRHVAVTGELMAARITSLVEQARFFDHSWLVDEGLVSLDLFAAMFGIYGLAECVNALVAASGRTGTYGHDADATALGWRVVERVAELVTATPMPYCAGNDGRAFLHSQSGIDSDLGVTAGTRIPIGTEPALLDHLLAVAPLHRHFASGVSDIVHFDDTATRNPQAVVDVIRGAFATGMRDVTFNLDSNDFIRITGYLVRKSDLARLEATGTARHGSDVLAAGSVANSHVTDRVVKRVVSAESSPRTHG
jgi:YjjI family glycine radical enzyme